MFDFDAPPLMIRAAIQAARITKNRSRGITSLPVLGAAAAQDEALGEKYSNGIMPVKSITDARYQRK